MESGRSGIWMCGVRCAVPGRRRSSSSCARTRRDATHPAQIAILRAWAAAAVHPRRYASWTCKMQSQPQPECTPPPPPPVQPGAPRRALAVLAVCCRAFGTGWRARSTDWDDAPCTVHRLETIRVNRRTRSLATTHACVKHSPMSINHDVVDTQTRHHAVVCIESRRRTRSSVHARAPGTAQRVAVRVTRTRRDAAGRPRARHTSAVQASSVHRPSVQASPLSDFGAPQQTSASSSLPPALRRPRHPLASSHFPPSCSWYLQGREGVTSGVIAIDSK